MDIYKKYNFVRSQTALKDLESETTCPVRWKAQWLLKEMEIPPSLPMKMGQYFESLVIGSSADGKAVDDSEIPKNTNGSKKADQVRLEEQAMFCKKMLFDKDFKDYLGIDITSVQEVIKYKNNRIVIDAVGETDKNIILLDLKLTGTISSTFGKFAWGNVGNMDLLQQGYYQMVYEISEKRKKPVKSLLLVFDYSPKKGKLIVPVILSDRGRYNIVSRFEAMDATLKFYEESGWATNPSLGECKTCKVKDCPFRVLDSPVKYHEPVIL